MMLMPKPSPQIAQKKIPSNGNEKQNLTPLQLSQQEIFAKHLKAFSPRHLAQRQEQVQAQIESSLWWSEHIKPGAQP